MIHCNDPAYQQEENTELGKKEYTLMVDQSEYLPVKDVDIFLTDAANSEVGIRVGRVCFGNSY